jgi:hypothetical protein
MASENTAFQNASKKYCQVLGSSLFVLNYSTRSLEKVVKV